MTIKRIIQLIKVKSSKNARKDDYIPKSDYEKEAIGICRNTIQKASSELLVCPQTGKRYVKNDVLKLYIIIKPNQVDIINHHYFYNVPLSNKAVSTILIMFDGHVGIRRNKMENEIRANTQHSLADIYKKVRK